MGLFDDLGATLKRVGDAGMANAKPQNGHGVRGDYASARGVKEEERTFAQKMDMVTGFDLYPNDEKKSGW